MAEYTINKFTYGGNTYKLKDDVSGYKTVDTDTWRKVQLNGTDKLGTSTSTNPLNLKAGTNISITESSGAFTFSATDTDTHRPIQVNGTQILASNTTALNLVAGSNITLTNSGGSVTIASSGGTSGSYLPLAGGTMTGTTNYNTENAVAENYRSGHSGYYTTTSYQTSGNEALVFASKNAVTSFMFVNGEDSITNHAAERWKSLTPGLQIKQNCVSIGELIPNDTTPSYKLNVNGSIHSSDYIISQGVTTGNISASGLGQFAGGITAGGPILTSFKNSVAIGSREATSGGLASLVEDLRYSNGAMGSVSLTAAYSLDGVTIPAAWYNYVWLPHRVGGLNGSAQSDNCNYGTLLLFGMTGKGQGMYRIRYSSGISQVSKLVSVSYGTGTPATGNGEIGDVYIKY